MSRKWKSPRRNNEISAFIGTGTEFKGELVFEGMIRLDGRFSGEIHSAGTLIIGESANVTAEIFVDTVLISGEVHGTIRSKNRVELHSPARHYGDITAPVVTIDEGVVFEGNCNMIEVSDDIVPDKKIALISSKDGENPVEAEIM